VYDVRYDVTVDVSSIEDSGWAVYGTVYVYNQGDLPMLVESLSDTISHDGNTYSPRLTCDYGLTPPFSVDPNWTVACDYAKLLYSGKAGVNNAEAVASFDGSPFVLTGSAAFDFPDANAHEIDECVMVSDSFVGDLGEICVGEAPATFTYLRRIGPFEECGQYKILNTAKFKTNDQSKTGFSSWTIVVDVPCEGCTLTPGYWKTHSKYGPAPYDPTWDLLGEDTPFFLSGLSYYEALHTQPKGGNAYFILAHAYIATQLNELDGTAISAVSAEFDEAAALFAAYTPQEVKKLKGDDKAVWTDLATTLDDFNNGLIGPGHCTE
jgi:hypothetical protein